MGKVLRADNFLQSPDLYPSLGLITQAFTAS